MAAVDYRVSSRSLFLAGGQRVAGVHTDQLRERRVQGKGQRDGIVSLRRLWESDPAAADAARPPPRSNT